MRVSTFEGLFWESGARFSLLSTERQKNDKLGGEHWGLLETKNREKQKFVINRKSAEHDDYIHTLFKAS